MLKLSDFYYKNNRLHQLMGFYHVVQRGSVSKAAEFLRLSQSTVSQRIKSLERDLGITLFAQSQKDRRLLEITPDGEKLYEMVVPLIQGFDSIYEEFHVQREASISHTIDICAIHPTILYILPNLLKIYEEKFPSNHIYIRNLPFDEAKGRLLDNTSHLALYPANNIPDEFEFTHVADFAPSLVIRRDNPLARAKKIDLYEVAKHNIVRIDPHLITLPMFEEVITHYGFKSKIHFEKGDWEILKSFVEARLGMAMISNISVKKNDPQLLAIPLQDYFPQMAYGFLQKKGRKLSYDVQTFLDIVIEYRYKLFA